MTRAFPRLRSSDSNVEDELGTADFGLASVGPNVVFVWRREVSLVGAHAFLHVTRKAQTRYPDRDVAALVVYATTCRGHVPREVPELIAAGSRADLRPLRGVAVVVKHEGFAAAGVRSTAMSIREQAGLSHPRQFFRDERSAVAWLATLDETLSPQLQNALVQLVDRLCLEAR